MIKGGTSGAGKTGSIRSGWTQYFIPCQVTAFSLTVQANIELGRRAGQYSALVKIENALGTEVTLITCSYFQVQKYKTSGIDNASVTIQKSEVWSIWGDTYTDLLKPSKRTITILAGLTGSEIVIFKGRITGMQQSEGQNGGAINLTCQDHRVTLQRTDQTPLVRDHSRYCEIHHLAFETFRDAAQLLVINDINIDGEFSPVGDSLSAVAQALSGAAEWVVGDVAVIGSAAPLQVLGTDLLSISDAIITSASRDFYDASAYNTINITGLSGGTVTTDTVVDASDVTDRGTVLYPSTLGSERDDLETIRTQATALIAGFLAGRFSTAIAFNPYLLPGMVTNFASTRFNITATTAQIALVRHQYQFGAAYTWLDGVSL